MGSGKEDYKMLSFITVNPIIPSISLIPVDVDLDHLTKARFLYCEVILSYPSFHTVHFGTNSLCAAHA